MKTAVLSDTHNLLRPQVSALLKGCDAVIHAGDIGGRQLAEDIRRGMGWDELTERRVPWLIRNTFPFFSAQGISAGFLGALVAGFAAG